MKKTWSVRAYQEGDEDRIFELVRAVWVDNVPDKERWLRGWRWVHFDNPAGSSMLWVAQYGNKLVGHNALIMEKMKIGKENVKGSQMIDIMTHPEYRRQGMAFAFDKNALGEAEEEGIYLVIGFPNEPAYPLHMKVGWLDVCAFQIMFKPLNLRNLLERYVTWRRTLLKILTLGGNLFVKAFFKTRRLPEISGLAISRVSNFDNRFDDFWNKVSSDYNIIVVRDKKYLNWRYVDVPNAEYTIYMAEKDGKVCGYIVLGSTKANGLTFGRIYDIIAPLNREDIIQCLISKAIEHFAGEKADAIFSQMVANKVYHKALFKNGFIPRLRSKSRFIAYNASPELSDGFLKNPKNWFIQLGDLPLIY